MNNLEYEQELADMIRKSKKELMDDRAVFEHYGPIIKKMNKQAYDMFKSGYKDSVYWNEQSILNAGEALSDLYRRMVNRSEAGRKAAATRKANKASA
jgi:leucyl-tRNA synthetase